MNDSNLSRGGEKFPPRDENKPPHRKNYYNNKLKIKKIKPKKIPNPSCHQIY